MRGRNERSGHHSLAEKLNEAMAQLHSQKLEHQRETYDLRQELSTAHIEIERLKAKLKGAKRIGQGQATERGIM